MEKKSKSTKEKTEKTKSSVKEKKKEKEKEITITASSETNWGEVLTGLKHPLRLADCPITSTTVYSERAEVTRQINFTTTTKGVQELVINGIVPTVNEDSFRVSGGIGNAVILEVSYEVVSNPTHTVSQDESQAKAKEIEEKINELEEQMSYLDVKLGIAQKEQKWFQTYSLGRLSFQDKVAPIKLTEAEEFMQFISTNLSRMDEEIVKLNEEKDELAKHIARCKAQKPGFPVFTTLRQVTISLAILDLEPVSLEFSYMITGASWKSRYDARVSSAEKTCTLTYLGVITNQTGEDWNNVQIALSTATPSIGGEPPKLFPLKIDFAENVPVPRAAPSLTHRARRLSVAEMIKSSDALEKKESAPPITQQATEVQTAATSATYHIARKVKIASDNKPHKVVVAEIPVQVEFQYIIIPSKSQYAYLKAKAVNKSAYQLLDGEMNVFMDGFYITTSQLQKTAPGEEFKLYLGTDNAVKVQQKPSVKQNASTGLINKKTTKTNLSVTEVSNNKSFEITVLVYVEYPFTSDTQNIKIKREEPVQNVSNVEMDSASVLCYTLQILPGKKEKVRLKYSIEHPEDRPIYLVKQDGHPVNY